MTDNLTLKARRKPYRNYNNLMRILLPNESSKYSLKKMNKTLLELFEHGKQSSLPVGQSLYTISGTFLQYDFSKGYTAKIYDVLVERDHSVVFRGPVALWLDEVTKWKLLKTV